MSIENETKAKIIQYLDEKMELYINFRTMLYSLIDSVHYSPYNMEYFKMLQELYYRMDELSSIKMGLTGASK